MNRTTEKRLQLSRFAPECWVLNPWVRAWQSDGKFYVSSSPTAVFEVPEEMIEFLLLFRQPSTRAQIEEVADVEEELFDLLFEHQLLIDAAKNQEAERQVSPPASPLALARGFTRELIRVVTDLFRGERLRTPRAIRERRWTECRDCGWYAEGAGGLLRGIRCRACGCHLPTKIAFNSSQCPLGRW